ncbi:hypothetical protein ACFX1Q_023300 [Malus domestica]
MLLYWSSNVSNALLRHSFELSDVVELDIHPPTLALVSQADVPSVLGSVIQYVPPQDSAAAIATERIKKQKKKP